MKCRVLYLKEYSSPAGGLLIGEADGNVLLCDWKSNPKLEAHIEKCMKFSECSASEYCSTPLIEKVCKYLDEYFKGERKDFSLPIAIDASSFGEKVLRELQNISYGRVVSYSELAKLCGCPKSVRAIARIVAANRLSILLPCHRVIGADGKLHGYAGGLKAKEFLLNLEKANSAREH